MPSGPHARAAWVALGLLARRQEGRLEGLPDHLLTTGPGAEDAFGVAYLLMRATRWEEGRVLPRNLTPMAPIILRVIV